MNKAIILLMICALILAGCADKQTQVTTTKTTAPAVQTPPPTTDTGAATMPPKTQTPPKTEVPAEPVEGCVDEQEKDDYYAKGTTRAGTEAFADTCSSEQSLVEYYCAGTAVKNATKNCFFMCKDGACTME